VTDLAHYSKLQMRDAIFGALFDIIFINQAVSGAGDVLLMHGEVSADDGPEKWVCSDLSFIDVLTVPVAGAVMCTGHGLKCIFALSDELKSSGVSCEKTGLFK
jgi:hypothetical protein